MQKMYSTNFTVYGKKVCLSLHYNGDNSYLFVNNRQIIKFKAKDSEVVPYRLCLGNTSKTLVYQMQQDYIDMFMILVLIIKPLQMIKYMIFMGI